jgi:hypothetical protein
MTKITRETAIAFANQLRSARLAALGDAEAFDGIIHVVERLGSYLSKKRLGDNGQPGGLSDYAGELKALAANSGMAVEIPNRYKLLLTSFNTLYHLVRVARNEALHQGAFARHLTRHAIELAIILEDALSNYKEPVTDFMVRNPVCAELWQPVGFIRQQMLANSYSCLPVFAANGRWHVVSDDAIARFLGREREGKIRRKQLSTTLREAASLLMSPTPAEFVNEKTTFAESLDLLKVERILLVRNPEGEGLLGILTAFDLL